MNWGKTSSREKISEGDLKKSVDVMAKLNKIGEELGRMDGVHALTDVTGFGLLGHLNLTGWSWKTNI